LVQVSVITYAIGWRAPKLSYANGVPFRPHL